MKWLVLPSRVGWEDQRVWLILTVKANTPEALWLSGAIPISAFSFQHSVSCARMPLIDLLNYRSSDLLKIKQLCEAEKILEHSTLEAELCQGDISSLWQGQGT